MTGRVAPASTHRLTLLGAAVVLAGSLVASVLASPVGALPLADATQTVTYRGTTVQVPASWAVVDLSRDPSHCVLFNASALYLGAQSTNASCPASALGVTAAAQLQPPSKTAPAAGTGVDDATGHRIDATSSGGQVEATLSYEVASSEVSSLLAQLGVTKVVKATPPSGARARAANAVPVAPAAPAAPASAAPVAPAAPTGPARAAGAASAQAPLAGAVRSAAAAQVTPTLGFDTCAAPSVATMATWYASSPYRTAGIYLGGVNAACGWGNLSAAWITAVAEQGWSFIPTYVGLQAPCVDQTGLQAINPAMAAAQGQSAADDAVAQALNLGLRAGTPIYFDSEAYNNTIASCTQTVLAFLSAWTAELHADNYVAGVYGSSSSTIADLVSAVGNAGVVLPDDIWLAAWNGNTAVFGDPNIPDGLWSQSQRLHQYQGGHSETWGGVSINVDNDSIAGATAIAGNGPPQSLQVFATTSSGQVLTAWQYAPGRPFDPWQSLLVPAAVIGSPTVGANRSGALLLFARTARNQLLLSWQAGPSRAFGGWVDMGQDGQIGSDASSALDGRGVAQVAVATTGGRILTSWQSQPNGAFGGWLDLGLPARAAGNPVLAVQANGGLQIFVRTTDGRMLTSWQAAPGQPLGGWLDLGLDGQILLGPTVGSSPNGAMSLFAVISGGRMVTAWQSAPNQPFGGWLDLGIPAPAGRTPAVAAAANGGLQLLVPTTDNRLLTTWQAAPGQPFGGWLDLGLDHQITSTPSAALNAGGGMQLFVQANGSRVVTTWQPAASQPFGGWLDLGLPGSVVGTPRVAVNLAGGSG
ncbi:MAG: glycoside hydrolase domain-containing protein [Acidimicrobiales bacterium]